MKYQFLIYGLFYAMLASTSLAEPLRFDEQDGLPVKRGDNIVIEKAALPFEIDWDALHRVDADNVFGLIGPASREEYADLGDRLEYTFEFRVPADPGKVTYQLRIPLPHGTVARVTHGSYRDTTHTDVVAGQTEKNIPFARFLTVESAGGDFSIDLDPMGAWQDDTDFDKQLRTCWVREAEEGLHIAFVRGWNKWGGGRLRAKLVIYPNLVAFETPHPFHLSSYKTPLETLYFLDFTNRPRTKPPVSVGVEAFNENLGYGWVDPAADLKIIDRYPKGLMHASYATSNYPGTFRMLTPPGDYLLTLIVGDKDESAGPMSLSVADQTIGDFHVEPGGFISKTILVQPTEGVIDIGVQGEKWILNGVILQPLMMSQEDYQQRRSWWIQSLEFPETDG